MVTSGSGDGRDGHRVDGGGEVAVAVDLEQGATHLRDVGHARAPGSMSRATVLENGCPTGLVTT